MAAAGRGHVQGQSRWDRHGTTRYPRGDTLSTKRSAAHGLVRASDLQRRLPPSWGSRGPRFKSHRPNVVIGTLAGAPAVAHTVAEHGLPSREAGHLLLGRRSL